MAPAHAPMLNASTILIAPILFTCLLKQMVPLMYQESLFDIHDTSS